MSDDMDLDDQVEAVMLASRVIVAITARSMADLKETVTLPQFRVLIMVRARGSLNLAAIAEGLGVHPSNATRACDRLVSAGLLERQNDPVDRRQLKLTLTADGCELLDRVMEQRRAAIADVLDRMPAAARARLVPALSSFVAAEDINDVDAWAATWAAANPDADNEL